MDKEKHWNLKLFEYIKQGEANRGRENFKQKKQR